MTHHPVLLAYRYAVIQNWYKHDWKEGKALLAPEAIKTEGAFEAHVWDYMRGYFKSGDVGIFIDRMAGEIENQWTRAWNEGARQAGVEPDEMDEADMQIIEAQIRQEVEYVMGLAEDIDQAIVDGLTDEEFNKRFAYRPPMWSNRYNAIVDESRIHFSTGKSKSEWILGDTIEHCESKDGFVGCSDLAGFVLYDTEWAQVQVMPQGDKLACHGFNCACRLSETTKQRTPNGLSRVLDIVTAAGL